MQPIKDIHTTVKASIESRIRNPVLGTFIVTWMVYNWPVVVYVLSLSEPSAQRVSYAKFALQGPGTYFYPAIATAFIVILGPWLSALYRAYLDIPSTADESRTRKKREAALFFEHEFERQRVKLLAIRHQNELKEEDFSDARKKLERHLQHAYEQAESRYLKRFEETLSILRDVETTLIPELDSVIEAKLGQLREMHQIRPDASSEIASSNIPQTREPE